MMSRINAHRKVPEQDLGSSRFGSSERAGEPSVEVLPIWEMMAVTINQHKRGQGQVCRSRDWASFLFEANSEPPFGRIL
jgi:hypothetical protein